MNNCLMRRNVNTAVLLRTGQSKHVIVFIDRSAHRTQTVVAVGQYIWHEKSRETAGPASLNNSYVSDIVGNQLVKADPKSLHIP